MFSPQEREYLRLLARADGSDALAVRHFPNPVYRRKLLWSIRHKSLEAARDWELLVAAARTEERLATPPQEPGAVPVHTEPFAALFRAVGAWARRRTRPAPEPRPPSAGV